MSRTSIKVLWCLLQIVAAIAIALSAFTLLPWLDSSSVSELPAPIRATLPAQCPAYTVGHGIYSCFSHGTVSQNPVGFAGCATLFIAAWACLIGTSFTGRGFPYSRSHIVNS